jgi:hypothetical protein
MFDESSLENNPRFAQEDLTFVDRSTKVKNFHPIQDGRDQFGNRVFSSRDLGYVDKGEETKAAVLVSKDGEEFIKKNSGMLSDIDKGLKFLMGSLDVGTSHVDLNDGRSMTYLTSGTQSHVFRLDVGPSKYIIKVKEKDAARSWDRWQPYINEMLQTQTLKKDLGEELKEMNILLPEYLFATGQVSCIKFEDGVEPTGEEVMTFNKKLHDLVNEYVEKQRLINPLWKDILIDLGLNSAQPDGSNFIRTQEGSFVWVDPFDVANE